MRDLSYSELKRVEQLARTATQHIYPIETRPVLTNDGRRLARLPVIVVAVVVAAGIALANWQGF